MNTLYNRLSWPVGRGPNDLALLFKGTPPAAFVYFTLSLDQGLGILDIANDGYSFHQAPRAGLPSELDWAVGFNARCSGSTTAT